MSRKINTKKNFPIKDSKYNSYLVSLVINKLLKKGKKSIAKNILYKSFEYIAKYTKLDPLFILEKAIHNVSPRVYLKKKSLSDKIYQIPILLNRYTSTRIGIKWLIDFAKKRKKASMILNFSNELLDAYKGIGNVIKKKEEIHKMAAANKAFLLLDEK